jgi:hypothetical protein
MIGLFFSVSPIRAADELNQPIVVAADEVDLAKVISGGEVVFVSSGVRPAGFHAIDDDLRTTFQFSNSDPHPTLIVKLTDSRTIHRVSVVVGSGSEKVDVYLFNEFPKDVSDLERMNPLASIVDLGAVRERGVDFAPQHARYVALRWSPLAKDGRALVVAEVGIFSNSYSDLALVQLAAADPPPPETVPVPPLNFVSH